MRKIPRDKAEFTLPEFLAYAGIKRALRPYRRVPHFAIGLVLPEWERKTSYVKAALMFFDPQSDHRFQDQVRIFEEARADDHIEALMDMLQHKQTIIIFKSKESIPEDLRYAFDVVITIEPPNIRQVRGVVRWGYKTAVTDTQAEALICCDWRRLKLAMTWGRPMPRVLSVVEKMAQAAAVPRALFVPKRAGEALLDVNLEEMEGYGDAKIWGLELVKDLDDWRAGTISWDDVDNGVLLSGPPGTGKTIFAKALAASCGATLVATSYAQWQARGHLNDFLKGMQKSFRDAKSKAPAILFLDEIDAFGVRDQNSGNNASYDIKAINGLLEQLDGLEGREGVVVVAASNHPDNIDAAILRSGRLDNHIRIPLPDLQARAAIFRMHLRDAFEERDCRSCAELSEGASGADIQKTVRNARRRARRLRRPIKLADVLLHLTIPALIPPETLHVNAVHEIGHAVVGVVLGMELVSVEISSKLLLTSTHQPVGKATFGRRPWERRTKQHYLDAIAMGLGGMAAEQLLLGCHDDGVAGGRGSDLYDATRTAVMLERAYGMGDGLASLGDISDAPMIDISRMDRGILLRADRILQQQLERATGILKQHRPTCERLVDALVARLEMSGQEVLDAFNTDGLLEPQKLRSG
ncbi:AAA family ATPase [Agrobacterium rosae]|uniref:AAA family ATPase n=1 Tax=Agrobacterium rosae TaxID=1972867 RepID=UPI003A7FCE63